MYGTFICPICEEILTDAELRNAGTLSLISAAERGIECATCAGEVKAKKDELDEQSKADLELYKDNLKESKNPKAAKELKK